MLLSLRQEKLCGDGDRSAVQIGPVQTCVAIRNGNPPLYSAQRRNVLQVLKLRRTLVKTWFLNRDGLGVI